MKAKLGPYIHHWTTSQAWSRWLEWRFKKYSFEVSDSELTTLDRIVDRLLDAWQVVLNYTINQIQARRNRKVKVHIDPWDTWSMDTTLSPVILPMLKQLRASKHGAPFVENQDVPEHLQAPADFDGSNGDVDDNHFVRWDWVMDEMIWAFEQLNSDWEDQFHSGEIDFEFVPTEDGKYYEMVSGPNDTHKFDAEGHRAHSKRIDQGLLLFGKYFRCLWD